MVLKAITAVTLLLAPGVDGRQLLPFWKLWLDANGRLINYDAAMSDDVRAIIEIVEILQGWTSILHSDYDCLTGVG